VFLCAAPSIANVQAAVEHIYPLVLEFRMNKPEPARSSSDNAFCGGSAPTYVSQSHKGRRLHMDSDDDDF